MVLLLELYMQGFAPADEVLLFRQKDPKPCSPVRGPAGSSASVPNKMARELALLKQPLPERPIRDGGSAAPEGGLGQPLPSSTKLVTTISMIQNISPRTKENLGRARKVSLMKEG